MFNKRKNEVVRERKSGGVISTRKFYTNANKKAEEYAEGVKRIAKGDVSMNEPRRNGEKSTVTSAVWQVRVPVQETACVSGKRSTVYKHTASSLAKKEARVVPETAKGTQTARIGKKADTPVKKTELKTVTSQKVWREKNHPEWKELSARKQKPEPPAAFSARKQQKKPLGGTLKQPTKTINRSSHSKPKKFREVPRKLLLPKDQTSQAKRIQGKQPEYEASTSSESDLGSDCNSDYGNHIEWNGFDEPDNQIGVCCCLCEIDLGVQPSQDDKSEHCTTVRVVAVLPCWHAFHVDCLYLDELELKPRGEPSCVICESTLT